MNTIWHSQEWKMVIFVVVAVCIYRWTLAIITTQGQSVTENNGNEGVLHILNGSTARAAQSDAI